MKVKKVLKIVGNVFLWLFVAFSVLVTLLAFTAQSNREGLPSVFGNALVTVNSDSMKPEFKAGDLIIVDVLTNDEKLTCEVGDIVTFYFDVNGDGEKNEFNTHRIVKKENIDGTTYYTTRGDNHEMSTSNDKAIIYSEVVGKYTEKRIPFVGSAIAFLQKPIGFLCVIVIPLALFFLFELYSFISLIIKLKSKGKVSAEVEAEIKRQAIEEYLRQTQQNGSVTNISKDDSEKTDDQQKK